ncbi:MAG TPA: hypothetical protein VKI18_04245 [Albitalea sp.]|nr:hypothetical protein [Albitalea sp.]
MLVAAGAEAVASIVVHAGSKAALAHTPARTNQHFMVRRLCRRISAPSNAARATPAAVRRKPLAPRESVADTAFIDHPPMLVDTPRRSA